MVKVSINVLTKNRADLLGKALASVARQSYKDFEVIVINDGSTDNTLELLNSLKMENFKVATHSESFGIIASRQEALLQSTGEYVSVLDDDDEWLDPDKLKKQVEYLDAHREVVIVGGAVEKIKNQKSKIKNFRPETDAEIRKTMLYRNNFFTSTVMFRREQAAAAGGFIADGVDLCEDYDLWLRLGEHGEMYNFPEVFTLYRTSSYNKPRFKAFLTKQLALIAKHKSNYPGFVLASIILKIRLLF